MVPGQMALQRTPLVMKSSATDLVSPITAALVALYVADPAKRALWPLTLPMIRTRWGRIVNISSGAARGAGAIGPHYNASKAAVEGLTRGYAARLVKEGITVNAVAPGTAADTVVVVGARGAATAQLNKQ